MSITTKEVRPHDFRRTNLLDRTQLQAAQTLFDAFARAASQKMTATFHQPFTFSVDKLDQSTFLDLSDELETGRVLFAYSMSPLIGRALVVIPTPEVIALVDLRLAGDGQVDASGREPSELDLEFMSLIIQDFMDELARSLSKTKVITPVLESSHAEASSVTSIAPSEMCVAVRLTMAVAERSTSDVVLCLPYGMVRQLVDGLQTSLLTGGEDRERALAAETRQRLREVPLEVTFQFPSFVTTPAELLTLSVGDCLGLGHLRGRPLEVRSEGILVAYAEICGSGVHKAFEVKEEVLK